MSPAKKTGVRSFGPKKWGHVTAIISTPPDILVQRSQITEDHMGLHDLGKLLHHTSRPIRCTEMSERLDSSTPI